MISVVSIFKSNTADVISIKFVKVVIMCESGDHITIHNTKTYADFIYDKVKTIVYPKGSADPITLDSVKVLFSKKSKIPFSIIE